MKLEKFDTNKKKKNFVIAGIAVVLIALVGIVFYKSYALYKVEKSYNVLQGKVGQFVTGDIEFAVTVDGVTTTTIPAKGAYNVTVTCDNGAIGTWDSNNWGALITNMTTSKTKCSLSFEGQSFSDYIIALASTGTEVINVSSSVGYRYVSGVNNYVCFGSTAATCPSENLYQIIGVMPTKSSTSGTAVNRVKLIKDRKYTETTTGMLSTSTSANQSAKVGYRWVGGTSSANNWNSSSLKTMLNQVYWGSLGSTWQAYIDDAVWYTGANASTVSAGASGLSAFYSYERGSTASYYDGATSVVAKIGLMYPSDIGYSSSPSCGYMMQGCSNAWLPGLWSEWTIMPNSDKSNAWYWERSTGLKSGAVNGDALIVRPTFYLKEGVYKTSGTGTSSDPYRIGI